jgi:TRAP-type uncharacterized transport system substrate-binding protein
MRSKLMLEIASELSGTGPWPHKQTKILLREQGAESWALTFFASDAPDSVNEVARGDSDIAICNPGGVLAMAYRGTGPFKEAMPFLRAIMVLPQFDQLGFGVAPSTGINSLEELRERRIPLRVSLRGQRDHSVHLITNQVLSEIGFTLDDIVEWGGEVRYTPEFPNGPNRLGAAERGEIDALWDEAMPMFANRTLEIGWKFLGLGESHLQKLEGLGLQRVAITKEEFPGMPEDVWTVDFSGWPVFTRADVADDVVRAFCAALEARKDRIPWYGQGPMRLDLMCKDTKEGPMTIPLHPAAERFWREQGYLP